MKKIFTFILLAISTLAMAQAFPSNPGRVAAAGTDQITYAEVAAFGADGDGFFLAEDLAKPSGATYTIFAKENNGSLQFTDGQSDIVTTTSGGRVKSVSVNWAAGNNSNSTIIIYGKTSAYKNDGTEWQNSLGTELARIVYPATTATGLDEKKCSYVMIAGESEPNISSINVEWMDISTNSINAIQPTNGTIALSSTLAEPGDKITVTFTGLYVSRKWYELHSYTIDGKTTNLTEAEYTSDSKKVTFTMPAHDVVISADYVSAPSRTKNNVTLNDHPQLNSSKKTITMVSGSTYTFSYTADYAITGAGAHGPYTQGVSTKISNSEVTTLTNSTFSGGNGSFTLSAYNQGTATLSFTTVQTNDYNAGTITYNIVVVPREVMLITEYNGKFYAVANDLNVAGKLGAQEIMFNNDVAYIPSDAKYNQAKLTWKVCTKTDETYTIQNSADLYLGYSPSSPATMTLKSTAYTWYKYNDAGEDRFYYNGNEIVYYDYNGGLFADYAYDKCMDNAAYSHGAYEIGEFKTAEAQTVRTDLVADKYSTICMPYRFVADNDLTVYSIDNKETKNDMLHLYFCRLDSGEVTNAGQPYIIKSNNTNAKIYKIGNEDAAASDYRGLYGTDDNMAWSNVWGSDGFELGNILVINKQGEIKYVNYQPGQTGGILAHRAYIKLNEVPEISNCGGSASANAARRIVLSTEQVENPQVPTAIENTTADQINWNEPVYNIMGQRVARGTTGVLIQNGQKFIAE